MTNYSLLMRQRIDHFREILKALPPPEDMPAELLVISGGADRGTYSYRHVYLPGETLYFIFRKSGYADGRQPVWECVDRELNELMNAG